MKEKIEMVKLLIGGLNAFSRRQSDSHNTSLIEIPTPRPSRLRPKVFAFVGIVVLLSFMADYNKVLSGLSQNHLQWEKAAAKPDALLGELTDAVRETTKILYEKSPHLNYWLEQPLPKVYVYDTLDDEWSNVTRISACVDYVMLKGNDTYEEHDVCRWYPKICSDDENTKKRDRGKVYTSWRYNFDADVALVEWFNGYPARTYDPLEADLFVIPFPYISQCFCKRGRKTFWDYGTNCPFGASTIEENVISKLSYYNASTAKKHVWILGLDWLLVNGPGLKGILKRSLSLSLGASEMCHDSSKLCLSLVHPYLSTKEVYQPIEVMNRSFWTNPNVTYAVFGAFGTPRVLPYRRRFYKTDSVLLVSEPIQGLESRLVDLGIGRSVKLIESMEEAYQKSVFCLILPGDSTVQKRFFDVMMNGCIPITPTWPSNTPAKNSSWRAGGPPISLAYPYSPVHFWNDSLAGINYLDDVMVTFDGECGGRCAKEAMERVIGNETELRRLKGNVKKYAPLFAYGLEENAYRHIDAFAAILVNLRHQAQSID